MILIRCFIFAAFILISTGNISHGKPIFSDDTYPELHKKMLNHSRLFYLFHALPFGIGLNMGYKDEAALQKIRDFLSQDKSENVKKVTGFHPFELLSEYEGYAGIGLRGGGAVPGTAFRYMTLKKAGASEEILAQARKDVVKAIEALHVVHAITGGNGRMARGIQKLKSENPDDPPIPGAVPIPTPLFNEKGNPLPPEKNNGEPRADNSGGLLLDGVWVWWDSCSKDQLVGWVFAMATLYDAANNDPAIDQKLIERMREEAKLIGAMLREKHEFEAIDGEKYLYDLVIMDADGRPTFHHDLNPLSLEKYYFPPDSEFMNVFNIVMALGIVKALYHISGDPEAEEFLYKELMGNRKYLDRVVEATSSKEVDYIYMGVKTNFSNVNMVAIALFLNIFYENDPEVLAIMRDFMEKRWWNSEGVLQSAINLKQPYFHALYLAMTERGTNEKIVDEAAALLNAFSLEPYLNEERINCDEGELKAKKCLAIDEKTELIIQPNTNRGGHPVAFEALNPSIRPPSDFNARTDPFEVNGGGGKRINPGGDLHAAYWLLRYLDWMKPGESARSLFARKHMLVGGYPDGYEDFDGDAGEATDDMTYEELTPISETPEKRGGSCMIGGGSPVSFMLLILSLLWIFPRIISQKSPATQSGLGT